MRIHYPKNIDLILLEAKMREVPFDQVLYVLDLLCRKQTEKRKGEHNKGWVRLSSRILRENGIRCFPRIRRQLLLLEIIEDMPYKEGQARSYRFAQGYRVELTYIKAPDNKFWRTLEQRKKDYFRKMTRKYPVVKYFNQKLTIERQEALEWIFKTYLDRLVTDPESAWHSYVSNVMSLDAIIHGDYHIKIDDYGRLHTNLTNMSKGLRPFLRYDGQQLVEIDFVNCQPMLLSYVLEPKFWDGSGAINYKILKGIKHADYRGWNPTVTRRSFFSSEASYSSKFYKWESDSLPKVDWSKKSDYSSLTTTGIPPSTLIYSLTLSKTQLSLDSPDIQRYKNTTREGVFYEQMAEDIPEDLSRDDIKTLMYEVLFGQPTTNKKRLSRNKKLFQNQFPEVQKLINLIKSKGHEKLAHMLQSVESSLMFEHIVPAIQESFPQTPIFTIHDSVLIIKSQINRAEEVVSKTAGNVLGFTPQVSFKS